MHSDNESHALIIRNIDSKSTKKFLLKYLPFQNGCFIVISEGSDKIGSISVSISSSNKVNTAKVIPSKFDSMFMSTISERVSSMINGICLVSLYSVARLDLEDMKAIMGEIMNIVGEGHKE
jgi:hypothetical protein